MFKTLSALLDQYRLKRNPLGASRCALWFAFSLGAFCISLVYFGFSQVLFGGLIYFAFIHKKNELKRNPTHPYYIEFNFYTKLMKTYTHPL